MTHVRTFQLLFAESIFRANPNSGERRQDDEDISRAEGPQAEGRDLERPKRREMSRGTASAGWCSFDHIVQVYIANF